MNKAIEISKYIVNYANEKGLDITNLKLQKLLYYVQAAFLLLSEGKEPCFSDKIVAWLHGPVVENVYYEYSKYRGISIHAPARGATATLTNFFFYNQSIFC